MKDFTWDSIPPVKTSGSDPAAGAEVTMAVANTGYRVKIESIYLKLVCDATVANRIVTFKIYNASDGDVFFQKSFGAFTASQTGEIILSKGVMVETLTGTSQIANIPDAEYPANCTIATTTAGIVAGDNWAIPKVTMKRVPL